MTVEKLYSHVAVDTSIVKAAAYNEYMFGKASLNCGISFVTVSKVDCEGSFVWRKEAPTFNSASSVSDCSCRRSARGFTAADGYINVFDDGRSDSIASSKAILLPPNLSATTKSIEKYACFRTSQLLMLPFPSTNKAVSSNIITYCK